MSPVLGYWKIRGLVQPVKLLLEYTGTDYEEKIYTSGPAPDFLDKSDWKPVKYTLGLKFPNLPYYIDGDLKITQTNAILYHLARKHNLCGQTEKEKVEVDMLVNLVGDMRIRFAYYCYMEYGKEGAKETHLKNLADHLKLLSDHLAKNPWFTGDKVALPDFLIYEILDANLEVDSSCLKDFKNLKEFHRRFEELPAIKKYMASPKFIKAPLNAAQAKFNTK